MFEPTMTNLLTSLNSTILGNILNKQQIQVWGVFILCLFFSALGVLLSFWLFGSQIKAYKLWGFCFAIAVIMLGISYGAKHANVDASQEFTPLDLVQYFSQGFLWPSTWPALAKLVGIETIDPPTDGAALLQDLVRTVVMT